MTSITENYTLTITPRALEFIQTALISPEEKESYALVIMSQGRISGGYHIQRNSVEQLKQSGYYPKLFPKEYHNHGFSIYIEPLLVNAHYLPNPFVIDLVIKGDGTKKLDVKNPEFED